MNCPLPHTKHTYQFTSHPTSGYISQRIESRVSKRSLYTYGHCSIIHDNQKVETTQMSITGWADNENVVYTYNGMLFSLKKEDSVICYHMNDSWGHQPKKMSQSLKKQTVYDFHLHQVWSHQTQEQKVELWLPLVGEGAEGSWGLTGIEQI